MDERYQAIGGHVASSRACPVDVVRPLRWLRAGWADMRENLPASLSYGLAFTGGGYWALAAAGGRVSGTLACAALSLVAPLAAAGLYEISRRRERGKRVSFAESLGGLPACRERLLFFGAFLAFVLLGWERLSAILFALFHIETVADPGYFFRDVLLSGQHSAFVASYLASGSVIAAAVFSLSAVSLPMLVDSDTDVVIAMAASARAVGANAGAMVVWAVLIVGLATVGFATLAGMVVLLPLLGHASWHAYRDLTG